MSEFHKKNETSLRPHKKSKNKMAENQKKVKTLAEVKKTTTIYNLYGDCLLSVLAFLHPLENWFQRLTCSRWHEVVPVALSRVIQLDDCFSRSGCTRDMIFSEQEKTDSDEDEDSTYIRRVADLCPNLKSIHFIVIGMVTKIWTDNFNYGKTKR